jgi:hypothetical protein
MIVSAFFVFVMSLSFNLYDIILKRFPTILTKQENMPLIKKSVALGLSHS